MSSKSPIHVNDFYNPKDVVPRNFIENVIKGLRVVGHKERLWFPFTSDARNCTDHTDPNITENTRQIYFFIPPNTRYLEAAEFMEIIKSGAYKPSDPLPDCFHDAVKRGAFLKTYFKLEKHPNPEAKGKKASDNLMIKRAHHTKYKDLKTSMTTFADLPKNFYRYMDINLYKVMKKHPIDAEQTFAEYRTEHEDDITHQKINAYAKVAEEHIDDKEKLKALVKTFKERKTDRTLESFKDEVRKEFPTADFSEIIADFSKNQQPRINDRDDLNVKSSLGDDVGARVRTVCEHLKRLGLPKDHPITLTIPLHFGGHYHTYNARIYENHAEVNAVATYRGYPDKKVVAGIIDGIRKGLEWPKTNKTKDRIIFESQQDGVSCGPTSATVAISAEHDKTLEEQVKPLKRAVVSYRENRPGVKAALADIHYAITGLVMGTGSNHYTSKRKLNLNNVTMQTFEYCSLYNKTRPFTFGLRIRSKNYVGVYAARVTDEHCELLSIGNLEDEKDTKILAAVQQGIQMALGVEDSFFKDADRYGYDKTQDNLDGHADTGLVASRIDPNLTLDSQALKLADSVIGNEAYLEELGKDEHEEIYSFKCLALTEEQIIAKQPEWEAAIEKARTTKYVHTKSPTPPKKRSSGDNDSESSAEESSSFDAEESESVDKEFIKKQRLIEAAIREREELAHAFTKIYEVKAKKSPHLPLPVLFDHTTNAVKRKWKAERKAYNKDNLNRVLQEKAREILKSEYESQQEKYAHDLKVARILSGVLFFIPGLSHAVIWGVFRALHKDDIVKVRAHRATYNKYRQASKPEFLAANRIHHPENAPTKKVDGRTVFRKVFDEGQPITKNIPGQVHIYFWNGKKAKAFQKDYDKWQKHQEVETEDSSSTSTSNSNSNK